MIVLMRMWRNWNLHTLLVETENDSVTLENNLAVFQNINYWVTIWLGDSASRFMPKRMRQGARGWCTGMTQRDSMGREVGGRFRMGNTCTPVVDSCQWMAKPLQYCKVISCREPAHEIPPMTRSWGRKPDRQGGSGFQGFWKAAPGAHLKDDICLSDACFNRLLLNFCDTGRRPSLISFQIRINLEL